MTYLRSTDFHFDISADNDQTGHTPWVRVIYSDTYSAAKVRKKVPCRNLVFTLASSMTITVIAWLLS